MLDLRATHLIIVLGTLLVAPALAHARPPIALGTLEVHGTRVVPPAVLVMREPPAVPEPPLARLPQAARASYVERQRAAAERTHIVAAMRARGVSGAMYGPTLRDLVRREETARSRLRRTLEQSNATLTGEGWLLLAELRLEELNERDSTDGAELSTAALAPARAAYAQAAARGGTSEMALWARLREAALAANVGNLAAAQSGLDVVIANAPRGPLRATALVERADLDGGPLAAGLYARALTEGADGPLRAYVRFATMLASRFSDPTASCEAGVSILGEGDDATAELAAPVVGELLVRTGDLEGFSLPVSLAPDRAARALLAASEIALGAGERAWAELALQAAAGRAPNSPSVRAASARLAALTAAEAPPRETVSQWLVRQATRCQSDVLSAGTAGTTGDLDVLVRRQRGVARVVARVRPGAGIGVARFERCIEGVLPDPPALDSSTTYQGALRLR